MIFEKCLVMKSESKPNCVLSEGLNSWQLDLLNLRLDDQDSHKKKLVRNTLNLIRNQAEKNCSINIRHCIKSWPLL